MQALTHTMCPSPAQSEFSVSAVSLIIRIMTIIVAINFLTIITVALITSERVGYRQEKRGRGPDALQSK